MRNPRTKQDKEFQNQAEYYSRIKYECKNCGHKVVIPSFQTKNICDWCGPHSRNCCTKIAALFRANKIGNSLVSAQFCRFYHITCFC